MRSYAKLSDTEEPQRVWLGHRISGVQRVDVWIQRTHERAFGVQVFDFLVNMNIDSTFFSLIASLSVSHSHKKPHIFFCLSDSSIFRILSIFQTYCKIFQASLCVPGVLVSLCRPFCWVSCLSRPTFSVWEPTLTKKGHQNMETTDATLKEAKTNIQKHPGWCVRISKVSGCEICQQQGSWKRVGKPFSDTGMPQLLLCSLTVGEEKQLGGYREREGEKCAEIVSPQESGAVFACNASQQVLFEFFWGLDLSYNNLGPRGCWQLSNVIPWQCISDLRVLGVNRMTAPHE